MNTDDTPRGFDIAHHRAWLDFKAWLEYRDEQERKAQSVEAAKLMRFSHQPVDMAL